MASLDWNIENGEAAMLSLPLGPRKKLLRAIAGLAVMAVIERDGLLANATASVDHDERNEFRGVESTRPFSDTPIEDDIEALTEFVAARRDLFGDAFNETFLMRPGQYLTRVLVYFDNRGIDGIVNGLAAAVGGTSGRLRRLQTGFVRSYALVTFGGAALIVAMMVLVRLS
jgi:NADH:ubiquinone oxidoreductase subunit 5 (subunit L)/multisubunit Na+/H+ antiporter MnhA subunit